MPSRGHLGTPTLPSHPSGATATSTLLGSYARAVTLGLVTCLLVPNLARAQGGYEGDYLNLSLPGDGTTPDAHAMAEQQREALKGPRAAATASSQGDASYSLGFDLPPALLLPEIGLSYSSATGRHSVVARGWSLNAGMSIERIRGRELLGAYSDLLGSSELLDPHRVSGGGLDGLLFWDPAGGGEWRYLSTGRIAASISRQGEVWTVQTGGRTTTLEAAPHWGRPASWRTSTVRDDSGNTVDYSWNGELLEQLRYGGTTLEDGTVDVQPNVEVTLTYSGAIKLPSFRAVDGYISTITQGLTKVEVRATADSAPPALVREYALSYALVDEDYALVKVEQIAVDGGVNRRLASFKYSSYSGITAPMEVIPATSLEALTTSHTVSRGPADPSSTEEMGQFLDITGDGLPDSAWALDTIYNTELVTASGGMSWEPAWQRFPPSGDLPSLEPLHTLFDDSSRGYSQSIRCDINNTRSFGVRAAVDIDGDGFMDHIQSQAPLPDIYNPWDTNSGPQDCELAPYMLPMETEWWVKFGGPNPQVFPTAGPVQFPQVSSSRLLKEVGPNDPILVQGLPKVRGARVGFMDLDGDGFQDVLAFGEGQYEGLWVYYQRGSRGGGWETEPVLVQGADPTMSEALQAFTLTDQQLTTTSFAAQQYFIEEVPQIEESHGYAAIRDISGDGLPDLIVGSAAAATGFWSVYLGTGDRFSPFDANQMAWSSPYPMLHLTQEGTPRVNICDFDATSSSAVVTEDPPHLDPTQLPIPGEGDSPRPPLPSLNCTNFVDGFGVPRGAPRATLIGLIDMDGDGLVDLANFEEGVWWRNLGSSFSSKVFTLPGNMPGAMDVAITRTLTTNDLEKAYDLWVQGTPPVENDRQFPAESGQFGLGLAADVNGDGLPDFVMGEDPDVPNSSAYVMLHPRYDADHDLPGAGWQGDAKPGHLILIQTTFGAMTELSYATSAEMAPSGVHGATQRMAAHREVVTAVSTHDPVTNFWGMKEFDYADGVCDGGRCQGWGFQESQFTSFDPILGVQPGWIRSAEFLLGRDYAIEANSEVDWYVPDQNAFAPARSSESFYDTVTVGNSRTATTKWLSGRTATRLATTAQQHDQRTDLVIARDDWGNVVQSTQVGSTCAAYPGDWPGSDWTGALVDCAGQSDIRRTYEYVSNQDHSHFRMCSARTEGKEGPGWDPVEYGEFFYDNYQGQDPCSQALTDQPGLLTRQVAYADPTGAGANPLEWTFSYSPRGAMIEQTAPGGFSKSLTLTYGDSLPSTIHNSEGHHWDMVYAPDGQVTDTTDPNGVTRRTAYDGQGRPSRKYVRAAYAGSFTSTQTIVYRDSPGISYVRRYVRGGDTEFELETRQEWDYLDGYGDVYQTWRPAEQLGDYIVQESYTDAAGRPVRKSFPHRESSLGPGRTEKTGRWLEWIEYDGLGRPAVTAAEVFPSHRIGEQTHRYAPGWARRSLTDGGLSKVLHFDPRGRLVEVFDGTPLPPDDAMHRTGAYSYDAQSRVTRFTNVEGDSVSYAFDGIGRLVSVDREIDQVAAPWYTYSYDGAGPMPTGMYDETMGGLQVSWWDYDTLGRVTQKGLFNEATGTDDLYEWEWDHRWVGKRNRTVDPDGRAEYFYDNRGRLTSLERHWFGRTTAKSALWTYEVDFEGNTLATTWPSGARVEQDYDRRTRMLEGYHVLDGSTDVKIDLSYDAMGLPSGFETYYRQDGGGDFGSTIANHSPNRVESIDWRGEGEDEECQYWENPWTHELVPIWCNNVSFTTGRFVQYHYRESGWLSGWDISGLGGVDYSYSALGRVETITDADTQTLLEAYNYNPLGTKKTMFRDGEGLYTYSHQAFGQATSRSGPGESLTYTWADAASDSGRLLSWQSDLPGSDPFELFYDGQGRLVHRTQGPVSSTYGYDVDDTIVWEQNPDGEVLRFNGLRWKPGVSTLEKLLPMVSLEDGDLQWTLAEPSGHTLEVYDDDAHADTFDVRGAFDAPLPGTQSGTWPVDGFHGTERDPYTGLTPMGTRHMVSLDGMWLQTEPLLYLGPTNGDIENPMYYWGGYANGNAANAWDTEGRIVETLWDLGNAVAGWKSAADNAAAGNVGAAMLDASMASIDTLAVLVPFVPGGATAAVKGVRYATKADTVSDIIHTADTAADASKVVPGSCFVAGVMAQGTASDVPIESIRLRDIVAAASTDGGDEAWTEVASDEAVPEPTWSPRAACHRVKRGAKWAVLPALLAACEPVPTELPNAFAVVEVYDARTGEWFEGVGAELEVGDSYLDGEHLMRVTEDGVEARGLATVDDLAEADATWVAEAAHRVPAGEDWVLVLGGDDEAGHWWLSEVEPGERFAFQGRVFETADVDGDGRLEVAWSGDVLGKVVNTFVRMAPEVIDAAIEYADGSVDTLTGTPNHPFWVDAVRDYVPLGKLEVGTVLHVQGGGEAILVSKTRRQGEFEVFDFEVEGLHNFYVRGEGSDAAGVLVHNSTFKGGKHADTKLPVGDGLDSHHMPADAASPLSKDRGPAIQMDPADHRQTASYGNPDYVAQQRAMIEEGGMKGFEDAFLMDVDDVQSKFGSKYDDAILEAIDALPDSLD